ncbi:hypothetical protein WISP_81991 [Willisornis vidua]|uniref:Uncharacterized protein n=1 Tax=Willisornis vidua TaxID=1566151 RepID=A0ABQ9DA40_9PASS|nr:hypothetical protein WISP_81991 [Willisornis vidua]
MEKRNPNLRHKEGHQLRDRTGGRGRWWDGPGHANTVPRQLPPLPSARPYHRQPQDSQDRSLQGDRPLSPSSTLSSRSIRSHSSLAQGAQGKGPPSCRSCPGRPSQPGSLATSTAARSQRRRVSCWACRGLAEPEPQRQHKHHGWMDEAPPVLQRCHHIISLIPVPAATAGGSQATPANSPLSFQSYEEESSLDPQQEVSHHVKQETQTEAPAQEADSAVPQHADQETQTEEQNSAVPLLVSRETQTGTPIQEEENSAAPQLINQETQSEALAPHSPSAQSSLLSLIGIDIPARRQRLPLFRRVLRTLRWASRCPCIAGQPEDAGARRAPGDGCCCCELAKHPQGGTVGTGARAAPRAFPTAEGTAWQLHSWPWLIETSL